MSRPALLLAALALAAPLGATAAPALPGGAEAVVVTAACNGPVCSFSPAAVQVALGTTVEWQVASFCHTVTAGVLREAEPAESFAPPATQLNAFGSGIRCGGETFRHTFTAPGVVKYYCAVGFHELTGMQGVVVVA